MALHVVPELTVFSTDRRKAEVVVESDLPGPDFSQAIFELTTGSDAKNVAISAVAGAGLTGINSTNNAAYPVNAKGESIHTIMARDPNGDPAAPERQPHRYRIKITVAARLV